MTHQERVADLQARLFKVCFLRIYPLWSGDSECIELGHDLAGIIRRIEQDRSLHGLLQGEKPPMKYCQLEEEEALQIVGTGNIYYARERNPVWKIMVPKANIYRRETIQSCIMRNTGKNTDKYTSVLFCYPKATEFFTYSDNEIRPVDDGVFVVDTTSRS